MSIVVIIGSASLLIGITETAASCLDKAKDYAKCQMFRYEQRARRKRTERREFV